MNITRSSNKHQVSTKRLPSIDHSTLIEGIYTSKKENTDGSDYLREKQGTSNSLQILHPVALCFKEEQVLAAHPLSCHPWSVFGCQERGKKIKENGERGKQRENCRPLSIAKSEVIPPKFVQTKAYIGAQCIGNYKKKQKQTKSITRIKWEETRNCNKNNKSVKCR